MNASAPLDLARTTLWSASCPPPDAMARTLCSTANTEDDDEQCIAVGDLVTRLVDSLIASFTLIEYERQIVHHVLFGRSSWAIAQRLRIRETTVHKHMHRIFAKTKTEDRGELYRLALRLAAHRSILATPRRMAAAA